MKRVGIIGHYGFGLDLANGQTIKTKIVTEEVEKYCREDAVLIDAHGGLKAICPVIIGIFSILKNCKNIIVMLTENGLKVSVPILGFFNMFFKRRLHYVVIGGWLPTFLQKHVIVAQYLRKFHMIYVETQNMKNALEEQGFQNVTVMANCKRLDIVSEIKSFSKPFGLCTFSRVMREKGIEDAVEAVKAVNQMKQEIVYTLDIYGAVDEEQKEWFDNLQKMFPGYINYRGVVKFNESVEVLKDYFALLFPTYYEGEGFAGTAIDAFSAGVPVLASDWKYNGEVIKAGVNGELFATKNAEQLVDKLLRMAERPEEWNGMREQCIADAKEYSPEKVMKVLFDSLQ